MPTTIPPELHYEHQKVIHICDLMRSVNLTPKKFMKALLTNKNMAVKARRAMWGSDDSWNSTLEIVNDIRGLVCDNLEGKGNWKNYILDQAKFYVALDGSQHHQPREGVTWFNARTVTPSFFSAEARLSRDQHLMATGAPFLYELIKSKVIQSDLDGIEEDNTKDLQSLVDLEGDTLSYDFSKGRGTRADRRAHLIALATCSMIGFACNQRNNGLQLADSLSLVACGVTERVASYLHWLGLASSRKTANMALGSLGQCSKKKIIQKVKSATVLRPILCIDNIDFEQRVHTKTVKTKSRMFHGTWGYLHSIDPQLLSQVDPSDLTLRSYKKAIKDSTNRVVKTSSFFPTNSQTQHFCAVVKSQIAHVLFSCMAKVKDTESVSSHPPPIDPIRPHIPDITMLKMMVASDNSSKGIGEVLQGITNQTNETSLEACEHLQIMEGDLGTYCNLESLRALRRPTTHPDESLENVFMLLGASHILWNIAQAIFLLHYGDSFNSEDLGAWHTLDSLGCSADQPVTKKDFTLMISNMQRVHEVTILHCLLELNGKTDAPKMDEELPVWESKQAQEIIDKCYDRLFLPRACREAEQQATKKDSPNPKLANLLLRLHNFATVIEANRAMKAGDIGRLLNIWRMWCIISSPSWTSEGLTALNAGYS
ncbi:hypothetical protein MJO28_005680 [Puccinia striiformis f. sp. tritici]|uniref:Uncharacterized protein n=1 Tax=Puccinia striiformis f. sp. tritici TaxID=168172 RepID=A0ACC0ELJ8_9BASI|nr:hypothetical protein MJO28_005680 [Puccinia striiformis f. sp. tritici]